MSDGSRVAMIGALFHDHPYLMPILDEHLDDNEGEVLTHLVLSDVIRWMATGLTVGCSRDPIRDGTTDGQS
ncbi:MAG TPA: hypothetical protein VE081_08985 [Sporichthyaceae bacterium]|nr:hypothetical protein [Sporichthyaceae bacterium]